MRTSSSVVQTLIIVNGVVFLLGMGIGENAFAGFALWPLGAGVDRWIGGGRYSVRCQWATALLEECAMETRISPSGQAKPIATRMLLVGLAALGGLFLSVPGYAQMGMGGPGMMGGGA